MLKMSIWAHMFRCMEFSVTCEKQKELDEGTETDGNLDELIQEARHSLLFVSL